MHPCGYYVLDQGEIVETGTYQQLLEARGVYYRLYQKQFQALEEGVAAFEPGG